ncbi:diguanylate cyclase [Pseudomonas sp. Rh2]|uniref:Diguanylate cyclase n=1 Tax=Pseudomonas taiwanensis TaxID=470150 RepID=A0ABR6VGN2_9PSED|nr:MULTISPECIES: diguanylate cyclase [Pseudomonas]AVD90653.1 sensor domain-containing diguanylate cyclase [Pseudomonas sp. SWI44]MBC3478822.1 diguanylate cyclase [Pseudomonas taiwanensis]MBC3493926.1 diguanylate cyclase [Pseudomonas taiwanensis]WEZ90806.1 diguanylate cyclase [Pseudomonas sp. NyZ480]
MLIAPPPLNEAARLCFLDSLNILDTPAEENFDRITRLVSRLLDVPMALVSLVDMNRQWFKSRHGLDAQQTSRDVAFCAHALHADDILVIADAKTDPRFADNPLVVGAPFIRSYAGVPLRFAGGLTVGTLCALDTRPRQLGEQDLEHLRDLARIVERELLHRSLAIDARIVDEAERSALVSSAERFRAVFQEGPSSKAIISLEGRIYEPNREFCQLLGQPPEALVLQTLLQQVHAEDRELYTALVHRLLTGEQDNAMQTLRLHSHARGVVWVELSMSALRDEHGLPAQLVASVRDITELRRTQSRLQQYQASLEQQVAQRTEDLQRSQTTLQAIADNLPVLIAHIDTALRYRFNNALYKEIFGLDPAHLKGRKVAEVLPEHVYEHLLPYFGKALAGERVEADDVRYNPADPRIWHTSYVPDVRQGKVEGFFVMSLDVTERKKREKSLLDQATLDPLTGLPNRAVLQHELTYALRQQTAFALYFIDLDGFKKVNDECGHETGDLLLQAAASRMLAVMRADDVVARLAGDEFIVIAQSVANQAAARDIGRKLCDTLASPFRLADTQVTIGASIGIYVRGAGGGSHTPEEVLARADKAMYEAKRLGRNRCNVAPD